MCNIYLHKYIGLLKVTKCNTMHHGYYVTVILEEPFVAETDTVSVFITQIGVISTIEPPTAICILNVYLYLDNWNHHANHLETMKEHMYYLYVGQHICR